MLLIGCYPQTQLERSWNQSKWRFKLGVDVFNNFRRLCTSFSMCSYIFQPGNTCSYFFQCRKYCLDNKKSLENNGHIWGFIWCKVWQILVLTKQKLSIVLSRPNKLAVSNCLQFSVEIYTHVYIYTHILCIYIYLHT